VCREVLRSAHCGTHYDPLGQAMQELAFQAPVEFPKVPCGQAVGAELPAGQKPPLRKEARVVRGR
jgi:hypothetical protein